MSKTTQRANYHRQDLTALSDKHLQNLINALASCEDFIKKPKALKLSCREARHEVEAELAKRAAVQDAPDTDLQHF